MAYLFRYALTFTLVASLPLAASAANSIGISMMRDDGTGKMEPATTAGVEGVRQANWNNLSINGDDPNGHSNSGELTELVDSNGDKVAKMRVDVQASSSTQLFPAKGVEWGFIDGDAKLIEGLAYPQPTIVVSNIPYDKYDVYVYAGQGNKGGHAKGSILGMGGTFGKDPVQQTYFLNYAWNDGQFVQGGAKDLEESKASVPSNYFLFKDLRGDDFTFDFDGKQAGGGWAGVAGIQIVEKR